MFLTRRDDDDDDGQCYRDGFGEHYGDCGFWYTEKGTIAKWIIFAIFFLFFLSWLLGGYIHAKSRLKKGLPLLGYHRWLVSYSTRRRYGQAPQNHFSFYNSQRPYAGGPGQYGGQYGGGNGQPMYGQQRADGTYSEPPPMYGGDAPPSYFAPPGPPPGQGGPKPNGAEGYPMTPQPPSGPYGGQQMGVVGSSSGPSDVEAQNQSLGQTQGHGESSQQSAAPLPPRPEQAKLAFSKLVSRFKR